MMCVGRLSFLLLFGSLCASTNAFLPSETLYYSNFKEFCLEEPEVGICRGSFPKYFHNATSGQCEKFIYGGCHGNGNRFNTKEDCEKTCLKRESACDQPVVQGKCRAAFRRYYYHKESGECKKFIYGGCGKNQNNFFSKEQCENKCVERKSATLKKKMEGLNTVEVSVDFSYAEPLEKEQLLLMYKDISLEGDYIVISLTTNDQVQIEVKKNKSVFQGYMDLNSSIWRHSVAVKTSTFPKQAVKVDDEIMKLQKVEEHIPRFQWLSQTHGEHWNDRYNRGHDLVYIGGMWRCDERAAEFDIFKGCIKHVKVDSNYPVALHYGQAGISEDENSCVNDLSLSITVPDSKDSIGRLSSCSCTPHEVQIKPYKLKKGMVATQELISAPETCHKNHRDLIGRQLAKSTNSMIVIGLALMLTLLIVLAYIKRKQTESLLMSSIIHMYQDHLKNELDNPPPRYEDQDYATVPPYDPPPTYEHVTGNRAEVTVNLEQRTDRTPESQEEAQPLTRNA